MTVKQLITELQKFPANLKIIGYHNSGFSDKPALYEKQVKINNDGYIDYFDEDDHRPEQTTQCLVIDFE